MGTYLHRTRRLPLVVLAFVLVFVLVSRSGGEQQSIPTTTGVPAGNSGSLELGAIPANGVLADSGTAVCAVLDGGVWCWGDGSNGQRGEDGFTLSAYSSSRQSGVDTSAADLLSAFVNTLEFAIDDANFEQQDQLGFDELASPGPWCADCVLPENATGAQVLGVFATALAAENEEGAWGLYAFDYESETSTLTVTDPISGRKCQARIEVDTVPAGAFFGAWDEATVRYDVLESGDCRTFFEQQDEPVQPHPTLVRGMESGVSTITAGRNHFCGIRGGGVWCWGSDAADDRYTIGGGGPGLFTMGKLGNPGALSSGSFFLSSSGVVSGYLVSKSFISATPVPVLGLDDEVSQVAAGWDHTCALRQGEVFCWGANNLGQIGTDLVVSYEDAGRCEADRSTCNSMKPSEPLSPSGLYIAGEYVPVPQKVEGLGDGVRSISAFGDTSCALTADGAVMCWGNNSRLEIGSFANTIRFNDAEDGDSYSHYTPVPIVVEGFTSGVSLLGQRCAVRVGQVACWGQNNASELDFDNDDKYLRLRPREAVIAGMDGKVQALLGLHYLHQPSLLSLTCGLVDGVARCWESELGSAPNDGPGPYTLQSFTSPELQKNVVAMGDTCAMVLYDNSIDAFGVWCWGRFELSDGKFEAGVGVPDERFTDTYDVSFEMPWLAFCYSEGAFYRPVGPYGVQECGAPPAN